MALRGPQKVNFPLDFSCFSEIIDVRSSSEFEEDHLPGAINLPVLGDAERAQVGTDYKQTGSFEARRVGAGLVSANIARHFESHFHDKPRDYSPLVYCWRGGMRSNSLATVLSAVGWNVSVLDGGYKTYRRWVIDRIAQLGPQLTNLRVISGLTGSGKTELLRVMQESAFQVLDLEGLANHRGSLLGADPDSPQPSQKAFESRLLSRLEKFELGKPVYVESESRKVGNLSIPESIWMVMRTAKVARLETPTPARIDYLLRDYDHFFSSPDVLIDKLRLLRERHGAQQIEAWETMIGEGDWREFVGSLLKVHYDPLYSKASYFQPPSIHVSIAAVEDPEFKRAAGDVAARLSAVSL